MVMVVVVFGKEDVGGGDGGSSGGDGVDGNGDGVRDGNGVGSAFA